LLIKQNTFFYIICPNPLKKYKITIFILPYIYVLCQLDKSVEKSRGKLSKFHKKELTFDDQNGTM